MTVGLLRKLLKQNIFALAMREGLRKLWLPADV
jgi:hypothetical protein